jgi:FAD:protein FMN transferase
MAQPESSASFPAFGGIAVVAVGEPRRLRAACTAVQRTVAEFDLACSRFREDSELSALNAAAGSSVRVSPLFLAAVSAALRAARLTDGDVDPTVGQALIALGYDRDFASVADGSPLVSIQSVPGWWTVQIDPESSTIRLARGVKLDLGATAKALAADRAAACASAAAGCGVLVSLSGDIATAGETPSDGWRVRVTDDHRSGRDAPGQWISLQSGGLATSSTTVRRWCIGSQFAHHLVDPGTGRPANVVWRTVSVAAGSCLDANIASTAAIVRGERAAEWLESLGLPSRLVRADGGVRRLAGWPVSGDDLPAQAAISGVLA